MTMDEKRLIREMHFDRDMSPTDIAAAVLRHISAVCRLLAQTKALKTISSFVFAKALSLSFIPQ